MPGFIVGFIVTLHIAVCLCLMASILLQSGKGGGLAGTFGAGSSQTLFGGRGAATFLSRATTTLAVIFFLTSLTLGLQASRTATGGRSLIQEEARKRGQQREMPGAGAQRPAGAPTRGAPVAGPAATPGAPASGTSNPAPSATPGQAPGPTENGTQAPATGSK
jgi:preprotein translocase subunit SecG